MENNNSMLAISKDEASFGNKKISVPSLAVQVSYYSGTLFRCWTRFCRVHVDFWHPLQRSPYYGQLLGFFLMSGYLWVLRGCQVLSLQHQQQGCVEGQIIRVKFFRVSQDSHIPFRIDCSRSYMKIALSVYSRYISSHWKDFCHQLFMPHLWFALVQSEGLWIW